MNKNKWVWIIPATIFIIGFWLAVIAINAPSSFYFNIGMGDNTRLAFESVEDINTCPVVKESSTCFWVSNHNICVTGTKYDIYADTELISSSKEMNDYISRWNSVASKIFEEDCSYPPSEECIDYWYNGGDGQYPYN